MNKENFDRIARSGEDAPVVLALNAGKENGGSGVAKVAGEASAGASKVSRRGFLKKAGIAAAAVFVGIPLFNDLFFKGDADAPRMWREGQLAVTSGTGVAYAGLEVVECEWVWPEGLGNPIVSFGIKNITDNAAFRKVDVRVMVLGKSGHLLAEEAVTIPSILPGETCRLADTVASNVDSWIASDRAMDYRSDFSSVEVFISGVGETVNDVWAGTWPYNISVPAAASYDYAKAEITLAHDHVEKALLGDAVLSVACVSAVWRDGGGNLVDAQTKCVEGLKVEVPYEVEFIMATAPSEIYVRPWRRDEGSFDVFNRVEVAQRKF